MIVLSLFDWISCARLALDRAWLSVDTYFASEIDKYAIQIASKNYKNYINLWDVRWIKEGKLLYSECYDGEYYDEYYYWDLPIDLLIWWSPCQDLSIAKKNRKWLDGERSSLFWEYVRILKETEPKYFVLENVASMSKKSKAIITNTLLEIYPDTVCHMINASLVSAQNRKRLFRTNIQGIEQPQDRGILLKDILEEEVDEKYYVDIEKIKRDVILSNEHLQVLKEWRTEEWKKSRKEIRITTWKDSTLRWKNHKAYFWKQWIKSNCITTWIWPEQCIVRLWQIWAGWQWDRIYSTEWKSTTLSAHWWGRWAKTWLYKVANVNPSGHGMNGDVYDPDGKSPTLTTNKWEWRKIIQRWRWFNKWWEYYEKSPTITSNCREQNNKLTDGQSIRKLTPVECERLQWVPDGYTEGVSNTQRYKCLWNAFNVDVVAHILSYTKNIR